MKKPDLELFIKYTKKTDELTHQMMEEGLLTDVRDLMAFYGGYLISTLTANAIPHERILRMFESCAKGVFRAQEEMQKEGADITIISVNIGPSDEEVH